MTQTPFAVSDTVAEKKWRSGSKAILETYRDENLTGRLISLGVLEDIDALQKSAGGTVYPQFIPALTGKGHLNGQDNSTGRSRFNVNTDELTLFELSKVLERDADGTLPAQLTEFGDFSEHAADATLAWLNDMLNVGVLAKLTGSVHTSRVYRGETYSGSNLLQVQFGTTPTAPDSTRMYRPNGLTTDQAVGADTTAVFKLSLLSEFMRRFRTLTPYMPKLDMNPAGVDYVVLLHPDAWYPAEVDVSDAFQYRDIQLANIQSGKQSMIKTPLGFIHNNIEIILDDRLPRGVDSGTGAEVANSRRGVVLGKKAGGIAFGKGYSPPNNTGKPLKGFRLFEDKEQVGRLDVTRAAVVAAMDKYIFDSKDYSAITFTTYAVA